MQEMSNSEQLIHTTVKISSLLNGETTSYGTGFFFNFLMDEQTHVPTIVTNKHVLQGADSLEVRLHIKSGDRPSGRFANVRIAINDSTVTMHPAQNIDLCAVHMADVIQELEAAGHPVFAISLSTEFLPSPDDWHHYDAMEELTMIGCPNGLTDEANNLPIARRGIAATAPSRDYNGKPEFMVDMACFPGSSGSPIFIYNQNGYFDKKKDAHVIGVRGILVGILYSGPLISNTGSIILGHNASFQLSAMMHLGNAIKSSELLNLEAAISEKLAVIEGLPNNQAQP